MKRQPIHQAITITFTSLILSGCALIPLGMAPASTPSGDTIMTQPTITPTPTVTPAPTATPSPVPRLGGTASSGEVLYTRDGVLYAALTDGSGEHTVADLRGEAVGREVSLSPDGHFAAFTVDALELVVVELTSGNLIAVDTVSGGVFSGLVWSADSSTLYYGVTHLDLEDSSATAVQIRAVTFPENGAPIERTDVELGESPTSYIPAGGLTAGYFLVYEVVSSGDAEGRVLMVTPEQTVVPLWALDPDRPAAVWDVSTGGSLILLSARNEGENGERLLQLVTAPFSAGDRVGELQTLTPANFGTIRDAAIEPGGNRVAAIRVRRAGDDGRLVEIVTLAPSEGEGDTVVETVSAALPADPQRVYWVDANHVMVTLQVSGEDSAAGWLVTLDDSADPLRAVPGMTHGVMP